MPIISNFPTGSGSGGGLALAAVSNIDTLVSSGKVYVKWTDPDDMEVSGSVLAAWAGTLLVRKAGAAPTSRRDGTVVLDSKTKNAYSATYFCDSGLTNGTKYYYKFFPYTTQNVYTDSVDDEFNETPIAYTIGDVANISAVASGNGKVTLKWEDPSDRVRDDITIAAWGGTKVVYKTGNAPTSVEDGTLVTNSTTRDAYKTNGLVVTGLTNGTTYYFGIFPYTTEATGGLVNTASTNTVSAVPNRIKITTVPSQSGTLTYTGSAQTPSWSGYDSTKMTLSVTAQTNAGTYSAAFTPKTDYCWSDGTTTAKSINWAIGKATGSLSVNKTSVTLNGSAKTATFTVTRIGDGKITVSSNKTSVATVSPSSSTATGTVTFTISSVNDTTGTATITVSVAAGTNHTAPANKTIAVTASFKPTASTTATSGVTYTDGLSGVAASDVTLFAEAISNNSNITNTTSVVYIDFGSVHRKISIGDQISLDLNGTSYVFDVIGFNHDALTTSTAYGTATETGKAGITLQMHDLFATTYSMNSLQTNSGGWKSSAMRTSTMDTMKGYLPSAWQSAIKPVNKASGTGDGSSSDTETVSDNCFLLSEIEIFGSTTYSVSGEGVQYAYYKAGNSKIKNRSGSADSWWERSPRSGYSNFCCLVNSSGSASNNRAFNSFGVAFGFCV